MDRDLIEKYRREMLDTYRTRPTAVEPPMPQEETVPEPMPIQMPEPQPLPAEVSTGETPDDTQSVGRLIAIVTAIRSLYPVKGATVTIFTGTPDNKTVIATDITDESGRTGSFILPTPARQLSLQSGSQVLPYSQYNMLVEAEGYLDTIHLNIPVFSGVTSLQQSDMMLLETSGVDKSPRVFDEEQQFTL